MITIHLNDRLENLQKSQIKCVCDDVFVWVTSKYKHPKNLTLVLDGTTGKDCGSYDFDDKEITVFYKKINTVKTLIEVILHEFKHSKQDGTKYMALCSKYSYTWHPYEVAARDFSKKRVKQCWNDIKHNYIS